ncbi:hypothetical protein CF392_06080 [Tamilnaduibacter salinus]|uniref:Uncharacterized protein n=1 Tax=Tamilnaduibacter salinus TaxID=1484056 RepID=A0A2A2I3V4_9GAMM|nr:hypothetical protein [Tamilnaduibacter salinus]PAV26399.1 hypothetical protein CF392_06080 [Tamilnaduibacter salinus]
MLDFVVLGLEIGLALLFLVLAGRIIVLSRRDAVAQPSRSPSDSLARPAASFWAHFQESTPVEGPAAAAHQSKPSWEGDLTAALQIIMSIQITQARHHELDLATADGSLKSLAAAWGLGAAVALSRYHGVDQASANRIAVNLLARRLSVSTLAIEQTFSDLTGSTSLLYCYRMGVEGAESWVWARFVPRDRSLYEAITANALI